MQINNNVQTPNFGRLRINQNARQGLKELSPEVLEKISQAGEQLKNTKFYDVDINFVENALVCHITSLKNAFFDLFKGGAFDGLKYGSKPDNSKNKDIVMLGKNNIARYGMQRYSIYGDDSRVRYALWDVTGKHITSVDCIDQLVNVAKEMDSLAVKVDNDSKVRKAQETVEKQIAIEKTDKLMEEFGV